MAIQVELFSEKRPGFPKSCGVIKYEEDTTLEEIAQDLAWTEQRYSNMDWDYGDVFYADDREIDWSLYREMQGGNFFIRCVQDGEETAIVSVKGVE